MPVYRFDHPRTGKSRTLSVPYADLSAMARGTDDEGYDLYEIDGDLWRRDYVARPGDAVGGAAAKWPIESFGAGVDPEDVPAEMERCRANGVAVNFTRDGRPIFESHAHRRQALRVMGLQDRLAYV